MVVLCETLATKASGMFVNRFTQANANSPHLATARRKNLSEFSQVRYFSGGRGKGLQLLEGLP
jgi:hypothetical protein